MGAKIKTAAGLSAHIHTTRMAWRSHKCSKACGDRKGDHQATIARIKREDEERQRR